MARKRTLNRRDLRDQAEAAEARELDSDEDEVEDDEEASAEDEDESADDENGDGDDEEVVVKPKKKAVAKKKAAPAKRTRAVKEVRTRATWVVFDNSSKRVESFPYNQKAEAEALLAKKIEEKKTTFYLQLVKEPLE